MAALLETLTVAALDQPVRKASSSQPDRIAVTPAFDVLLHVCTHAQYTSAQAVNMLRQLGADTPDLQLITMSRDEQMRASS